MIYIKKNNFYFVVFSIYLFLPIIINYYFEILLAESKILI